MCNFCNRSVNRSCTGSGVGEVRHPCLIFFKFRTNKNIMGKFALIKVQTRVGVVVKIWREFNSSLVVNHILL